jgi:hypothetical protein
MAKQVLVDPLPGEVKKNVYARAEAAISVECHSPLIALRNGTPGFMCASRGIPARGRYMRVGVDDWLFEIDDTSGSLVRERLSAIHRDRLGARARVRSIMSTVERTPRAHGGRRAIGLPGSGPPAASAAHLCVVESAYDAAVHNRAPEREARSWR